MMSSLSTVECIQPGRMHCHPYQVAYQSPCRSGAERGEEPFELTEAPLLVRRNRVGWNKLNKNLHLTDRKKYCT